MSSQTQSASSASGEKSFTGLDFDPTSLPCPGHGAVPLRINWESNSQLDSTASPTPPSPTPPSPSPTLTVPQDKDPAMRAQVLATIIFVAVAGDASGRT